MNNLFSILKVLLKITLIFMVTFSALIGTLYVAGVEDRPAHKKTVVSDSEIISSVKNQHLHGSYS